MITKEYGRTNKDVIILLHMGGLSWWNSKEVAELLEKNFHVIIPILDGHSETENSRLEILKSYSHGDLSINHAEEYVKKLIELIN